MTVNPIRVLLLIACIGLFTAASAACGDDKSASKTTSTIAGKTAPVIDPGDNGSYTPDVDPANFVVRIDNPYMSFLPGARWVYEGKSEGEVERVEITVLDERRDVMGISAVVVRDAVHVGGELVEDTYDWFAQDRDGNVWYLGEDVKNYEGGKVVDTAGSWEAGRDGALPGIVMPAAPGDGDVYRQEFYAGEAEDMFEIIAVGESLKVKAGVYDDVIVTKDWSPLEPKAIEKKYYARGVGKIREEKIAGGEGFAELVEYTPGS